MCADNCPTYFDKTVRFVTVCSTHRNSKLIVRLWDVDSVAPHPLDPRIRVAIRTARYVHIFALVHRHRLCCFRLNNCWRS